MTREEFRAELARLLDELVGDPVRIVLGVRAWWRRAAS